MTAKRWETRRDSLYMAMAANKLDAAVLDNRDDQFYFTGYTGSDAVVVLSSKKRQGWLITDSRYTEEAEKTAPGIEVVLWRGGFGVFLGKLLRKARARRVGYTPSSMRVAMYQSMTGEARSAEWTDIGKDIAALRAIKDKGEVEAVRAALACAQAAFETCRKRWKAGMTETEVKNDLEWEMRRLGAEDAAFETIVAVGANASLPHAHAGSRKIMAGKMLLIDFGARLNRYNSDLTRTLWAGNVPAVWMKRYRAVLAAQAAGLKAIMAGNPGSVADARAREVFAAAGIEDKFTHGLGHGVGLAVHEEPRLTRLYDRHLEAGQIVTVEPGVYFPGAGGIRVEDMALVTESGAEVLSSLARDEASVVF